MWAAAAAVAVAAALVALVAVLEGDFSETDGRIIATLALVLYTGGAAFAGLTAVDRGWRLGWAIAGVAAVSFFATFPAVWGLFDEDGDDDWRVAWTGLVTTLGGLLFATAWLMARGAAARRLALAAGVLAALAVLLSDTAIWSEDPGGGWAKLLAVLWIVAVLAFVLTPLVSRLAEPPPPRERVLATLDDVELVATTGSGLDPGLAPGERLLLRKRG